MLVVDIAQEIYMEAGEPTTTSIAAISFWIRAKVGAINNLISEDFSINTTTLEIYNSQGQISIDAVAIIKQLYRLYDLQIQFQNTMNALAGDSLLSVVDAFGGGQFIKVNKNEIAKSFLTLRKDEMQSLNQLVNAYKINRGIPAQVAGDDTIAAKWGENLVSLRNV